MDISDVENFQTPEWVMELMVREIPKNSRLILEPTPGAGYFVKFLEDSNFSVCFPKHDYFDMSHSVKYDCVVGNPPFTPMTKGYEILYSVMEHTDNIVMLMPWLTLINSQKRLDKIMEFGLKKIIHLPRNAFKGARVQTCVLVMSKSFCGDTIFNYIKE